MKCLFMFRDGFLETSVVGNCRKEQAECLNYEGRQGYFTAILDMLVGKKTNFRLKIMKCRVMND